MCSKAHTFVTSTISHDGKHFCITPPALFLPVAGTTASAALGVTVVFTIVSQVAAAEEAAPAAAALASVQCQFHYDFVVLLFNFAISTDPLGPGVWEF